MNTPITWLQVKAAICTPLPDHEDEIAIQLTNARIAQSMSEFAPSSLRAALEYTARSLQIEALLAARPPRDRCPACDTPFDTEGHFKGMCAHCAIDAEWGESDGDGYDSCPICDSPFDTEGHYRCMCAPATPTATPDDDEDEASGWIAEVWDREEY